MSFAFNVCPFAAHAVVAYTVDGFVSSHAQYIESAIYLRYLHLG